ncbi:MAG: septum formation initiator family protein [Actinomycetes bacterium]
MARPRTSSKRQPNYGRRGNGRALALGVVLFLLALTLAPPTQRYFAQRAQISALQAQVTSSSQALKQAAADLQKWQDPQYVKSQARERLHFILPGERQYIVTTPSEATNPQATTAVSKDLPAGLPWYKRLISSITETGPK